LRRPLGGIEFPQLIKAALRITAASAALAGVSWVVWDLLDGALGRSTLAQAVSLGTALAAGGAVYLAAILAMRVPEARQLLNVAKR
jgi:putative peptidoglycan lipid II flippase